jgi:hypothetical protein
MLFTHLMIKEQDMEKATQMSDYGIERAECLMLYRLLQLEFEEVPIEYLKRIYQGDLQTIVKWTEAISKADCLEDVFKSK